MSFAGYDGWKLATPPEYEQSDPPDDGEDEPDELVCSECRTVTLADFAKDGRCEDCDGPVEESEVPLMERLKLAHRKALNARDILLAAKIVQWVAQVERIEVGLREIENG